MGKQVAEIKSFELKLDAPPDDEGRFTGHASVFGNVDKGNDVVEPGAFTKTLQETPDVPIFWVHNYDSVPIGVSTSMAEDTKGLRVEGQLFIDSSESAREVFGAMKAGAVKGLSIGYNAVKRSFKGSVRHLQEVALGEFSLCPFPMNELAGVDGMKARKYLDRYSATGTVDCVLSLIENAADYLASEIADGDTDDIARLTTIMPLLTDCLASEINDLVTEPDEGDDIANAPIVYEGMRAPIELAVKNLQALLDAEPATATRSVDGAATEDATEPDVSTLRALMADIKTSAA